MIRQECFLLAKGESPHITKDIEMKSFLAFVLISALGVFTIGCGSEKGTTENKTVTTSTQTKDGKTVSEDDHERHEDKNHYSSRWRQGD